MDMRQSGRSLALASSLWLADAVCAPEALAGRMACSMRHSTARACRVHGVVTHRRAPADIYGIRRIRPSRRLISPPRTVSDAYLSQMMRRSLTPRYARHILQRRSRGLALQMVQISPPFRFAIPQPCPEYFLRPCYTRFADPLGCTPLRLPGDPFVEALLGYPNSRTAPILRALGLPVILNVPPIVLINKD
jgi:hypothetical protein